ncbi:MAG: acyl-CoA dehydratase activase [Bacillota bacterium]|jgi:predicted CoA-substrate-specific enzyme activase
MRVGLPRVLSFYYLFPWYRTFLDELGVSWVESQYTSENDLGMMHLCPTDEPCISVKVAFVHAHNLLQKADCLFVPRVVSLSETAYCCPKMIGLPCMLRAGLELGKDRLVSPLIDFRESPGRWRETWIEAARVLGVRDRARAVFALDQGIMAWEKTRKASVDASSLIDSGSRFRDTKPPYDESGELPWERTRLTIGVMGHGYILHDFFGQRIVQTAKNYGPVITAENVPLDHIEAALGTIPDGHKAWTIEGHILGAALSLLRSKKVDRMVFVSAFSCGPASIIENYIALEAEAQRIPLLNLAVDEHSGDVGLITRLEAFMDAVGPRVTKTRKHKSVVTSTSGLWVHGRTEGHLRSTGPVGLVSMGNLEIPMITLFSEMGVPAVAPPRLTEDIVNSGKELAPEFICYPMVTLLGQMRKLADDGVDRIIMVHGKGRCRLGWYAQVMETILHRAGYNVRVHAVDSPFPLRDKWGDFVNSYREVAGECGALKSLRALSLALKKLQVLDTATDILFDLRAYEEHRGGGDRLFGALVRDVEKACTFGSVRRAMKEFKRRARDLPRIPTDPLRVALVGEIYVLNEPFVNKDVEAILGSLEQRVRVHRNLTVTNWLAYHLFRTPKSVISRREVIQAARPYLDVDVGGHGLESVGETVQASLHGMDGAIHLFPFTCMPEIIAQNILVKVSKDRDFPVLSLMISEQTGVQGLVTRLEAFCDLLAGRKKGEAAQGSHYGPIQTRSRKERNSVTCRGQNQKAFLGVDVGSVTTKIVLVDEDWSVIFEDYQRNDGGPIDAIQKGFRRLCSHGYLDRILAAGTTGSGRELANAIIGADLVKNEISCHARAASHCFPDVGTLIDIGGQDSKIVFFRDGYPIGFNMNTVCAAGTGSFLDHQSARLGIPIHEFGEWALKSRSPARIAGRCGVFAESDLIHKQQMGYRKEDLIAGLCAALAANYLTNVARGQPIRPRVLFQGGVAANAGILKALQDKIGFPVTVPPHFRVMGAWGVAIMAAEKWEHGKVPKTNFRGAEKIARFLAESRGFPCYDCANNCEIQEILIDESPVARWGSKCGKWQDLRKRTPCDGKALATSLS